MEKAIKKARRENYTCKRKGNQQQLNHALQVLDKFDEASSAFDQNMLFDKVKATLEEGTSIVSKRAKGIKLADKGEFGWQTVNEYLSDDLESDSDDSKKMYRVERRRNPGISVVANRALLIAEVASLLLLLFFPIRQDLFRSRSVGTKGF